ncbi:MAG: lantibiotic dehydratase [Gemmatimonadaceae bacterium]|nr:lantibiotic dehydratase [Gemmatimonadaceae bacterium]
MRKVTERIEKSGSELADRLTDVVPLVTDRRERGILLEARRSLFKGERVPPSFGQIEHKISQLHLGELFRDYELAHSCHDDAQQAAAIAFEEERQATVQNLVALLRQNEDFAKAVALSSPTFWRSVQDYEHLLSASNKRTSKTRTIERTLLQFAIRASTKCTPFSRFSIILPGRVGASRTKTHASKPIEVDGEVRVDNSYIRVNFEVLDMLASHLVRSDRLPLSLPICIDEYAVHQLNGDRIEFLVTRGKKEFVSSMALTDSMRIVLDVLTQNEGATVGSLSTRLHAMTVGTQSMDSHRKTIGTLVKLGVLRLDMYDDNSEERWVALLVEHSRGLRSSGSREMRQRLQATLRAVAMTSRGNTRQRCDAVAKANAILMEPNSADENRQPSKSSRQFRTPVFEDVSSNAMVHLDLGIGADALKNELGVLCNIANELGWPRAEQATMRRYYDTTFGSRALEVPLMAFYKSYYRDHMREHLRREESVRQSKSLEDSTPYSLINPLGVPLIERIKDAHHRVRDLLRSLSFSKEDCTQLEPHALSELIEDVPSCAGQEYSFGVFCHPPQEVGDRYLIPGGKFIAGFSKYYSRFSDLVAPPMSATLREHHQGFDGTVAEVYHCQRFNANIHAPHTQKVIAYPNSPRPSGWPTYHLQDLVVRPSLTDPDQLELVSRVTGERIRPVDLGFINPKQRPPLLQLLCRFGPQKGYSIGFPQSGEYLGLGERGHATFPRLNFGTSIALSRRQWRFSCNLLPSRSGSAFGFADHMQLLKWSRSSGVPEDFFATFHSVSENDAKSPKIEKIQFFRLSDPLIAEYFNRLVSLNLNGCVVIEEALPGISSNSSNGVGRPMEFILHVERYAQSANEPHEMSTVLQHLTPALT